MSDGLITFAAGVVIGVGATLTGLGYLFAGGVLIGVPLGIALTFGVIAAVAA